RHHFWCRCQASSLLRLAAPRRLRSTNDTRAKMDRSISCLDRCCRPLELIWTRPLYARRLDGDV
ncbi:hypothetical protein SPRG_19149, partial [Saprolegnia parasitica CBS 223.65]